MYISLFALLKNTEKEKLTKSIADKVAKKIPSTPRGNCGLLVTGGIWHGGR